MCQVELANCRTNQAVVLMQLGEVADADRLYRDAIDQLGHLRGRDRKRLSTESRVERMQFEQALGTALLNRGELLAETRQLDQAERVLRECVDVWAKLSPLCEELLHEATSGNQRDTTRRVANIERRVSRETIESVEEPRAHGLLL